MITFEVSGSSNNLERFLAKAGKVNIRTVLESLGAKGVRALSSATKQETGLTAGSWFYEVRKTGSGWEVVWLNSHVENGFPVAVMLQYGHGTGTGGYVQGTNYINPAIKPIFDEISTEAWKAVTSA